MEIAVTTEITLSEADIMKAIAQYVFTQLEAQTGKIYNYADIEGNIKLADDGRQTKDIKAHLKLIG